MAEPKDTKDAKTRTDVDVSTPDNATTEPEQTVEGQSFYNPAMTGSGTITVDGTYAEPLPDPTQVRGLGPDRTAGGRLVMSHLDPEASKVAEVTEAVAGTRAAVPERGYYTGPDDSGRDGTAKRGRQTDKG